MNDRALLGVAILTLVVAGASLTQTFLLTAAVTDQDRHINQLASQFGDLAGIVSSLMTTQNSPTTQSNNVVYLEVVPDFGGSTYDAFVLPTSFKGNTPNASSPAGAAPNNNITVPHGVPIKFVISNLDTALLQNFTSQVSVPFTLYNDTNSGEVALQYTQGETISHLEISHTFSIPDLQVNIPIPPDTMVVFTYTFSTPGVYTYLCTTPCGPGMGLAGYMLGYVTVT
jgi:heme/copper-type cytochrome/quinol oxidase subunit 2